MDLNDLRKKIEMYYLTKEDDEGQEIIEDIVDALEEILEVMQANAEATDGMYRTLRNRGQL